jgi:predicted flap endonuclease-1-like 5' DNA nuclease
MARRLGFSAILLGLCLSLMGSAYPLAQEAEQQESRWWVWVLIALVLLAFAAYVIWWWLNPKEETQPAVAHRAEGVALPGTELAKVGLPDVDLHDAKLPDVELPESETRDPGAIASGVSGTFDDLKVIEGIGPKIASILNAVGISSFRQLADLSPARILEILGNADPRLLRLADPTTWPQQAQLAADGAWDELQKLTEQLKGGRKA